MIMTVKSKDFKIKDGRTITFIVDDECIYSECGQFRAKYRHTDVNSIVEMHSKVLNTKQLKELRAFINESREPEQLMLF